MQSNNLGGRKKEPGWGRKSSLFKSLSSVTQQMPFWAYLSSYSGPGGWVQGPWLCAAQMFSLTLCVPHYRSRRYLLISFFGILPRPCLSWLLLKHRITRVWICWCLTSWRTNVWKRSYTSLRHTSSSPMSWMSWLLVSGKTSPDGFLSS